MRRQWLMVAVILGGLALLGWGLIQFAPPPEGAAVGRTAPDYRVLDLATGDSIGVRTGFEGEVTLLNVWATWCAPCRAEMPSMDRLYRDLKDRGFRIAAVSVDGGSGTPVKAWAEEMGLSFDILHDRSGMIQQTYRMIGVPQSFLIDRRGVLRYITLGEEHWDSETNRARVEALLAE